MYGLGKKYILILTLFASINLILIFIFFGWQRDVDTTSYVAAIDFLSGKNEMLPAATPRLIKPLGPLMAVPFAGFFGSEKALIVENIIFYYLSAYLVFKIADHIYENKKQATIASLVYIGAYPLIRWGVAALTDMSGWFFYLLSIYLTLLFLKERNEKYLWFNGFVSGCGLLFKETAAMGMLFLGPAILLLKDVDWKRKVFAILKVSLAFIIPVLLIEFYINKQIHYSFFNWINLAKEISPNDNLFVTILHLAENFFALLFIGWSFFFIGLYKEIKERNFPRLKLLCLLILPSVSFFAWPFWVTRLMFISGLLLSLLVSKGLVSERKNLQFFGYTGLIVFVIINYFFPKLINLNHLQDLIGNYFK